MVVACIALVVAMGGTGYAAITITGKNVKNNSLTGKDIKDSSLTGKDIKKNSLTGNNIIEAKLGKVPSASRADTAGSAGSAGNSDTLDGQDSSAFQHRLRWALVAANGTIIKQTGGISLYQHTLGDGEYFLDFHAPVSGKLIHATGSAISLVGTDVSGAPCGTAPDSASECGSYPGSVVLVETGSEHPFYVSVTD